MNAITHWYLHVDLDAFFASVEQLDHPEYRGKPVIVGGKPEDRRSVVSTASYEARKYGVHSAMPTAQAYKLCPEGIYVHGRMERYSEISYQIMSIFKDFSPDVQQMSIDEAFIDLTGTEKLFGPPEETALKIKETVKKNTGLTVSVGLATTKYLAKIASGFSKPNGFYYIHKGDEEKFMLALPLNKVWGLGPKSLELIKNKGFRTTRDIYEKDIDMLKFLFGNNMGSFLYDVVRGKEKSSFQRESKNHSISAETTFPYDLIDIYTIETELLKLAHGVFFRLLKENSYSRTAFVKIRYEDFTTCSIQETEDRSILNLDSYFEIIKRLFEKKYDNTRGIRLLGVGLENVESTDRPYQQDLFESNNTKKQAIEKAILNLEKKHPEIKVRKARTFKDSKTLKSLLLLPILLFTPFKAEAKDNVVTQNSAASSTPDVFYTPSGKEIDAPESLFNYSINDTNNVDFSISGYWQALFTDSLLFSFGNNIEPGYTVTPPVFKQEIELSSWVLLNNHWYFEADFADEFKKNTLAMGYMGEEFVRSVRLSNRNITMTPGYSAEAFGFDLKGGTNQAPGISAHFQSSDNKFQSDFLLRYDMTSINSATFYGMNQVSDTKLSPSSFAYGHSYKFPENTERYFTEIESIYVESRQGNYTDAKGRKYKKLSSTEYLYNHQTKRLYLSSSAGAAKQENFIPTVLITFINQSAANQIVNLSGSYNNPDSFKGNIQKLFDSYQIKKFNLEAFTASPLTNINNTTALVLQSSSGFSPYLDSSVYDCGLEADKDVFVISEATDLQNTDFITYNNSSTLDLYKDYFQEKHIYTEIKNRNLPDSSYPFATVCPEIYLGLPSESNLQIVLRSYTPVTEYQIGTEACGGTVVVYKNNIVDSQAVYNPNTGIVTLSSTPEATDKIYITWAQDSSDFSRGALSTGLGVKYDFTPELSGDILLSSRWPLSIYNNYSTPEDIQNGFAALSTGISYHTENLEISNKTAVSLQKDNGTLGLLVCSPPDNTTTTYYLESNSAYKTNTTPYISTAYETINLSQNHNGNTNSYTPISDSYISGYKVPLSWNFHDDKNWASVDIQLASGYLLQNSQKLNFALQSESSIDPDSLDLYLQLGIKADSNFQGEDRTNISCWKIEDFDFTNTAWQTVSIILSDIDCARFSSAYDARLIVVSKNNKNSSGTIYFGPYEPVITNLKTFHNQQIIVSSTTIEKDSSTNVSLLSWNIPASTDINTLKDTDISTYSYFKQCDFNNYGTIEFDFAFSPYNKTELNGKTEDPGFTLTLESDNSYNSENTTALLLKIKDISVYATEYPQMKTLSINLDDNTVYIDNNLVPAENYELYINHSVYPSKMKLSFNTVQSGFYYKSGTFYIGNLIFSDTKLYGNLQNNFTASYNKKDSIIKINDYDLLKDFSASLSSSQNLGNLQNISTNVNTNITSGITFADIKLQGDTQFNNTKLANAGHNISTEKPILKILELSEQYRFNPREESLKKNDSFALNFNQYKVPWKITFNTNAQELLYLRTQNASASSAVNLEFGEYNVKFDLQYLVNQKINKLKTPQNQYDIENYFAGWTDISRMEFSTGNEDAYNRNTGFQTKLETVFPFLQFSPNIHYGLKGEYNSSSTNLFEDQTDLSLTLPISFTNHALAFTISRNGGDITEIMAGGNYGTDAARMIELQQDRLWVYSSIPFYELFTPDLSSTISASYNTQYEIDYKRKLFNNMKDVFVPANLTFAVQRSIMANTDIKDLYQYKATITNNSLNNFGSNSQNQYFSWFKQEEIISSISALVKVPADLPENTSYQLSAYLQILFMIEDNSTLTTAADYSIDSNFDWTTRASFIYARKGKTSFISELITLASKKDLKFNLTRKDSLTIEVSENDNLNRQNYYYNHSIDYNFMKYFTLTTGIGGIFSYWENNASNIGLELSIGGKAEF